ncbi:MAG: tRNA (adenosine(37)-N6)-dimethylallyltransferase MiaA [Burkholderiales bacterium PBB5]|nr:MAG: tRNA (adenosine(37)-N6)-dimethylallyltransferase MiaA [Burkholderiales bacterium PBB5]
MTHVPTRHPRTVALAGPTASGKSALALAAAQRWPLEIISVDSALVYRGMDIGTAKPTRDEQAQVPHHLIDLIEPTEAYSAARFVTDARRLIGEVHARGHHALLVGGTMLYLKALLQGIDAMPPADAAVRAEIDARAAAQGWPALHAELALVDPVTAARLPPLDAQRIQRALEVWQLSGEPISAFHGRQATPGLAMPLLALEPVDRAWLHRRIAQRFDAMLDAGLLDEVRALRARGDLSPATPSMRCVGYRQAWAALDEGDLLPGQHPERWAQLCAHGVAATRQLAKRQLTWLRSLPRQVVACDAAAAEARGLPALDPLLHAEVAT